MAREISLPRADPASRAAPSASRPGEEQGGGDEGEVDQDEGPPQRAPARKLDRRREAAGTCGSAGRTSSPEREDIGHSEQPKEAERDHPKAHERDRIGDEDRVVVGLVPPVAAAVEEQQPQEGHRDRDQRPGEFIGVGLQLVGEQRRILLRLVDSAVVERRPADLGRRCSTSGLGVHRRSTASLSAWPSPFRSSRRRSSPDASSISRSLRASSAADCSTSASIPVVGLPAAASRRRSGLKLAPAPGALRPVRGGNRAGPPPAPLAECRWAEVERSADRREDGEHQEHREQEQRHRRDEAGALAGDVAPGQLAGPQGEQWQGPPQFAVEMEDAVGEIVPEGGQGAVDMALLPASMAMGAGQRRCRN